MSGTQITAVLSSFNRPEGLKRSFDSVVEQTAWDRMELIVCDDASADERVVELLKEFEKRPRVTVVRGEPRPVEHKEVYCTFTELINRALDCARGKYLSYITDGNLWTPERCDYYSAYLDEHEETFLVWGMVQNVRDGELRKMPPFSPMPMEAILAQIHWGNFIDHGSVMHRATRLRWSTSPESWRFADWVYWKRMLEAGKRFANVGFHGEVFYSDKDSLGRSLVERHESFREMYRRRAGGGNGGAPGQERKEEMVMVEYAKNNTSKIQLVPREDGSGNDEVEPGGIILRERVTTSAGLMWPDFVPHGEFPQYKPKKPEAPARKATKRRRSQAKAPPAQKVPFDRMKDTVAAAEKKAAEMSDPKPATRGRRKPSKASAKKGRKGAAKKASKGGGKRKSPRKAAKKRGGKRAR